MILLLTIQEKLDQDWLEAGLKEPNELTEFDEWLLEYEEPPTADQFVERFGIPV